MTVFDTPEGIEAFRLLCLRARLQLELRGLRFRGGSTYAAVKRQYGYRGRPARVLEQFEQLLRDQGILR